MHAGTAKDYRRLARRRLPRMVFDYIDGGAFDELTLGRNEADLAAVQLRQRVLHDCADMKLETRQQRAQAIVLVGERRQGHCGKFVGQVPRGSHLPNQVVAVLLGHGDVAEQDLGIRCYHGHQRFGDRADHGNDRPAFTQHLGQ